MTHGIRLFHTSVIRGPPVHKSMFRNVTSARFFNWNFLIYVLNFLIYFIIFSFTFLLSHLLLFSFIFSFINFFLSFIVSFSHLFFKFSVIFSNLTFLPNLIRFFYCLIYFTNFDLFFQLRFIFELFQIFSYCFPFFFTLSTF